MSPYRARRSYAPEGAEQHRAWLSRIEVSSPFLSLPVLRSTWPTLDALEKPSTPGCGCTRTTGHCSTRTGPRVEPRGTPSVIAR